MFTHLWTLSNISQNLNQKILMSFSMVDVILEVLKKPHHDKVHMDKTSTRDLEKNLFKSLKKKSFWKDLWK